MSSKIWLSSPHLSSTEIEFVNQSMIDSDFSTYGKNIIEFENELENF